MKKGEQSPLQLHIAEVAFSVLVVAWYVLPYLITGSAAFRPLQLADALYGVPPSAPLAAVIVTALAWVVPLICLWKMASYFLAKTFPTAADPRWFTPIILNLVSSGIVVALVVLHIVNRGTSAHYFASFPPFTYVVAAVSVIYNGYFIVMLIGSLSRRDVAYQEYLEFRRSDDGSPKGVVSIVQRQGIQRKLLATFVPLILVIIVVMAFFLLRDFKRTILASVSATGRGIAERTASLVKSNPTDAIGLQDYLRVEGIKNDTASGQTASLRFNSLTINVKDGKTGFHRLSWSTGAKDVVDSRSPDVRAPFQETTTTVNTGADTLEFRSPVILSKTFIGYVMVDYATAVIYEPYFKTQIKVMVIAALFMYASIFLIYLLGRNIVFPILFLRMSVYTIANVLSNMIKGKLRFSSELLQYKDRVNTHDEIKQLSGEVSHMTTVIRGLIPYISASTLKHSERETPTTERRNLTFLFTDIRGFTTISESMPPDKVVEMLNHYLDIQSTIIQENGGDVDKFVGDEVMAMFEGPKREQNACKAAVEIRKAMAMEKELAKAQGRDSVSIGIGINSGPVVHGSMGAKDRMDFTSIGDTVNIAARLEGTNKEYATKTLLTASVYEKVKDAFVCREIDLMTVKGKTQPVRIYELLQESKATNEKLDRMKKVFEESLGLYRRQKWDLAAKGFAALAKDYKDETSQVFLGRVAEFREDPPPKNWDGVFHRTTK